MTTVLAYPARYLAALPAPWRLRLRFGETLIDCTSSAGVEPSGWNRDETRFVLVAALEDRLTPAQVAASAAARVSRAVSSAATWEQVGTGLEERFLHETRGSVGEALRKIGAELVDSWSGDAAKVSTSGQEDTRAAVRDVRPSKRRAKAPVLAVR